MGRWSGKLGGWRCYDCGNARLTKLCSKYQKCLPLAWGDAWWHAALVRLDASRAPTRTGRGERVKKTLIKNRLTPR